MNTARIESASIPQGLRIGDIQQTIWTIGEICDRVWGILPQKIPCSMVWETPKTSHPQGWKWHREVTVERQ